jgi:hypothetical protein
MNRRGFIAALSGALFAPAIVRAASIMPVRMPLWTPDNPYRLPVAPLHKGLTVGDVVTFPEYTSVNRVTGDDTGRLRNFVVTRTGNVGSREIFLYPGVSRETVFNPWVRGDLSPRLMPVPIVQAKITTDFGMIVIF